MAKKRVKKVNPMNTSRCVCGSYTFAWVSSSLKVCKECEKEYRSQ